MVDELSSAANWFSGITTKQPQRVGSASDGVKVSPLPQPNIFANVTPLLRRNNVRSIAIRISANGILTREIFQK